MPRTDVCQAASIPATAGREFRLLVGVIRLHDDAPVHLHLVLEEHCGCAGYVPPW